MIAFIAHRFSAVAVVIFLLFMGRAWGDSPPPVNPQKPTPPPAAKAPGQRPVPAKSDAEIEAEIKRAELARRAAKAADDAARSQAKSEDDWNKMDPRIRNLLDPEITAAQYELVESCLTEYPAKLLDVVDKAIRDDVVTLSELAGVESAWDWVAKPKAIARPKSLIEGLRNFPAIAPERPDPRPKLASFEGNGSVEMAISRRTQPSDSQRKLDELRITLVKAAIRGPQPTAEECAKQAAFFGVKADALAKLEKELQWEARAADLEEIEHCLRLHPAELLKYVEIAYQDDKVT